MLVIIILGIIALLVVFLMAFSILTETDKDLK